MQLVKQFVATAFCWSLAVTGTEQRVQPSATGASIIGLTLKSAMPGDTIRVAKGIYRETISIPTGVMLAGEPGAVLDPSDPFQPIWKPADKIGPGVFCTAAEHKPATLFLDGKVLAEIDERRAEAPGNWCWKTLLATGPPRSGFRFVRGLWMYRAAEKLIYVHVDGVTDPVRANWSVLWRKDPVIAFRGAENAVVRGITVAHGYDAVVFKERARNCRVSECRIGPWDKNGVLLSGGATHCLVESNEVFRGAYEDWVPHDTSRERYEIWQIHKLVGFYDRVGIEVLRAGATNHIHGNHVFETFDGINVGDSTVESLDKPLVHPEDGMGTEIWHNLIENTRDSGMELGAGCIGVHVHDNVLRRTHGGLRYKLPRMGPVFIYRNVLVDGAPFDIWYSMDDSPAEGYVYHNTIIGGKAGLVYSSFNKGHQIGAPNWHYLNNLVITEHGFFENWKVNAPVNFMADYNLVVGGGRPWPNDPTKDQHSRYLKEFKVSEGYPPIPLPDSQAVDAGLDLSTYFHGKPLPGCAPGYFKGRAPDIGAFEVK